ncbi:chitin synthase-domain-containing protein [Catenaria anguillulae PL171]|uniref:chitin synthase n=1 Tax=Catenaria anguillulae PL171 TaxID=765915 RepID=A0A1Y2I2N1_9FUNG|nr:chitin synthase-domain-containing protein [Catenaria anguillulae PL171]
MYLFFGLALFPVVVNMFAAMIKLIMDSRYAAKVRKQNQGPASHNDVEAMPSNQPSSNGESAHVTEDVPMVYMMIPVYNEPLPNLLGALNGVAASDYPRLRVFVGYDKMDCEQEYFTLCRLLSGVPIVDPVDEKKREQQEPSKPRPSATRKAAGGAFKYNGLHQIVSSPNSPMLTATVAPSPALTPIGSPNWTPRTSTMGQFSSSPGFYDRSHNGSSTSLTAIAAAATSGSGSASFNHFSNGGQQRGSIMSQLASRNASVPASPALGAHTHASSPRTSISLSSELTISADTSYSSPFAGHHTMFSRDACPDEFTVTYRGVEFTIFRFEHSGKLGTQRNMFGKLKTRLANAGESAGQDNCVLFVDSDTHINSDAVSHLVAELHRYPTTKACTGFCVSRNEGSLSFWRILQDSEYIESMIYRNAESYLGSVTCLPGVLTMFRWNTLCEVSHDYFEQPPIDTTFEFARRYLGEDRYMSHLLMSRYSWRALGFSSAAVCKTEAPDNFYDLLRQRRRWYLGQVSNELIMLCTPELWAKFPFLLLTKFLMMLKVGGSLVYLLIFELAFMAIFSPASAFEWSLLWWLLLILVPNWLFISVWCLINGRIKSAIIFPAYYWWNPLFMVLVLVYSIATINQRTWGGPRAAAAGDAEDDEKEGGADDEVDLKSVSANGSA